MLFKGAKIARLGSARLGSSIAPFFQCVKLYYINYRVKSGSRVNYALISDFFCGKGACC